MDGWCGVSCVFSNRRHIEAPIGCIRPDAPRRMRFADADDHFTFAHLAHGALKLLPMPDFQLAGLDAPTRVVAVQAHGSHHTRARLSVIVVRSGSCAAVMALRSRRMVRSDRDKSRDNA